MILLLSMAVVARGENVNVVSREEGRALMDPVTSLRDQQAVLTHDVMFQRAGELFPHRSTLLVKSSLSYSALEAVPKQTREIAAMLRRLADNLNDNYIPPPEVEAEQDKYVPVEGDTTYNIRQARLLCKKRNMNNIK